MKVKFFVLSLFLLLFSMNSQAQSSFKGTKTVLHQEVTTVKKEATSASKKPTQQTKDNIKRRNMAKYKAMAQRNRRADIKKKNLKSKK